MFYYFLHAALPGMEDFKGRVIHTKEYKVSRGYEGKHVLVVGIGNSAADAAVDISEDARQVNNLYNILKTDR